MDNERSNPITNEHLTEWSDEQLRQLLLTQMDAVNVDVDLVRCITTILAKREEENGHEIDPHTALKSFKQEYAQASGIDRRRYGGDSDSGNDRQPDAGKDGLARQRDPDPGQDLHICHSDPLSRFTGDRVRLCYVLTVHQHLSFVRIIEPVGQFEKGGLAAAR